METLARALAGWLVLAVSARAQDAAASAPASSPASHPASESSPASQEAPASKPASAPASEPAVAESAPAPANEPPPKFAGITYGGNVDLRYRFRSTSEPRRDQDLISAFGFRADIPGVGEKGLHIEVQGSAIYDMDDFPDPGNPFDGLPETFSNRVHTYLYEAYGEFDPGGFVSDVRLGRQMLWREEGIRFDGVYLQTRRQDSLEFSAYGGVPVHLYESSYRGDVMAGVGTRWFATPTLQFTLDEIYVRERADEEFGPGVLKDLLSAIGAEWRPDENWTLRGSASMLDSKERRETLDVSYVDLENGFRIVGRVTRQNDFTEIPVLEFSPFIATMGFYAPYVQGQVDVSKTLGGPFEIGGGYAIRRLLEGQDTTQFNHEFDHAYVNLTLSPFPVEEMSASIRADGYLSDGNDTGGLGASIEKRIGKDARFELGTDYALYRVDLFTGEELFHDRQYYLRSRVRISDALSVGAGYRYEVDDVDEYHILDVTLSIRF